MTLSKAAIKRIAKRAGVKRVAFDLYVQIGDIRKDCEWFPPHHEGEKKKYGHTGGCDMR